MRIVSHMAYPTRNVEEVIVEDCHGRVQHIQVPIIGEIDHDKFLQDEMERFIQQEQKMKEHLAQRFDNADGSWTRKK